MITPSPSAIVAATYNIHYAIGTDRRFAPERIADVILSLKADVVALQEVGWHYRGQAGIDQFELLGHLTGFEVHQGLARNHPDAHFGNAILSRLPARAATTIDLSVPLHPPRCAMFVEFGSGAEAFRVVNLHLGLNPWERRAQVKRLLSALDGAEPLPSLLLGDFNEWRRAPAYFDPISQRFPHCSMPESFHARRPMFRYDRIYASAQFSLSHEQVVHAAPARRASDHLPVVATLLRG
ncbi:MAG: endonuclease [Alphaproteobacteria bacterium]|nr:endonuclease [Alphaproteobacteria bacterium]